MIFSDHLVYDSITSNRILFYFSLKLHDNMKLYLGFIKVDFREKQLKRGWLCIENNFLFTKNYRKRKFGTNQIWCLLGSIFIIFPGK